ncbi:MAG: mechanosensitive ion channel domain-containing protein [Myxococcota bacterium]
MTRVTPCALVLVLVGASPLAAQPADAGPSELRQTFELFGVEMEDGETPVDAIRGAEVSPAPRPGAPVVAPATRRPPPRPRNAPTEPEPEPEPEPRPVEAAAPTPAPVATAVPQRMPERVVVAMPESEPLLESLDALAEIFGTDRSPRALLLLLLGFLSALVLGVLVRRTRDRLAATGLLPTLLAALHVALRLAGAFFALALLTRALPPRASPVLLLALGGFAVALGWSTRDLLPDLVAGLVLAFERRVRKGMWVSGEGFAGQVEAISARAVLLRDARGQRVSVPNRKLLAAPVTADVTKEREQEVVLVIPAGLAGADGDGDGLADAERVRVALRDAVLSSPWAYPGVLPTLLRDPEHPLRWRVRARVLDPAFGGRFEGELLERVEERLRFMAESPPPPPRRPSRPPRASEPPRPPEPPRPSKAPPAEGS